MSFNCNLTIVVNLQKKIYGIGDYTFTHVVSFNLSIFGFPMKLERNENVENATIKYQQVFQLIYSIVQII